MKKLRVISTSLFLMALLAFVLFAFKPIMDLQETWVVPEKYVNMKNPVTLDDDVLDISTELYSKHCKSCHGKTGLGDGSKAAELDSDCGDFSTSEFQEQTDGTLFYKISFGRDDMPAFNKKIADEEELWMVVLYLRSMSE